VGAAVQPPRPAGLVESSHSLAAAGPRVHGASGGSPGPCLAISGVQARLIAAGASAGPVAAEAGQTASAPAPAARALSAGKPERALASRGPDPAWVPQFAASYEDDARAARGAAVQLPPPRAPLPPAFQAAIVALLVRYCCVGRRKVHSLHSL